MLAKTESVALVGTSGHLVQVEVYVAGGGIPTFRIVGLPTASVREADQRIKSALESSGLHWPGSRIIANLAPGNLRKEGSHFDLALALGILVRRSKDRGRTSRGVLAAAMAAKEHGRKGIGS